MGIQAKPIRAYHLAGTPELADLGDRHQEADMEAHHRNKADMEAHHPNKEAGDLKEADHQRPAVGDHLVVVVVDHQAGDLQAVAVVATTSDRVVRLVHLTATKAMCRLDGHLSRHGKTLGHRHQGHRHRTQAIGVHLRCSRLHLRCQAAAWAHPAYRRQEIMALED